MALSCWTATTAIRFAARTISPLRRSQRMYRIGLRLVSGSSATNWAAATCRLFTRATGAGAQGVARTAGPRQYERRRYKRFANLHNLPHKTRQRLQLTPRCIGAQTSHKIETVLEDAPQAIVEAADAGTSPRTELICLRRRWQHAPADVEDVVIRMGIDDPDTVALFCEGAKAGRDWWDDIRHTGYLQLGDEQEAVKADAGYAALKAAMKAKSRIHKSLAHDKQRQFDSGSVATVRDALALTGGAQYQTIVIYPRGTGAAGRREPIWPRETDVCNHAD